MSAKISKKLSKKNDKLSFSWTIKIPSECIEEEIAEQLKKIQARVHIDGFRQGKAPLDVVDKRYGEDALYRAVNTLARNAMNEIINDEKYKLALAPEIGFTSEVKRKEDLSITATFVLKPEIPEIKFEKIEVDTCELELSEADKKAEEDAFLNRMATLKLVEDMRPVANGDTVDIDFVGKTADDGVEFAGGNAKGYKLEVGSHSFIDGFEEQLIGHKKGETFDINVQFPKDYFANELKDKKVIFTITINDLYEKQLPELNDEYAKKIGFENAGKIRELLFSNLKNVYEANMKNLLKGKIFNLIIEKNKFDLPESVISREIDDKVEEQKVDFEKKNPGKKFDEKSTRKKVEENLHKSYASFYLTDGLANKNAIEVSDEEINQFVAQDAMRAGMDVKSVMEKLKNDEKMKNYVYFTIKEAKVFEFIFQKIKKNVKKLDKKAFEEYLDKEREKQNSEKNK